MTMRREQNALCGLAAVLAVLCVGSCCEEPTEPCLPWVAEGETYRVELVQRFESLYDDDPYHPQPYSGYRTHSRPCGRGLDLDEGSVVHVTAEEKIRGLVESKCVGGCYYRRASFDVENVVLTVDDVAGTRSVGNDDFSDRFGAKIGGDCDATYTIGISALRVPFVESNQYIATDHVLYRGLIVGDLDACDAEGSQAAELHECWDSWAVRIWDSRGNLISRDLPPKLSDAGTGDASTDARAP